MTQILKLNIGEIFLDLKLFDLKKFTVCQVFKLQIFFFVIKIFLKP